MLVHMEFDGRVLSWAGVGRYKATTGMVDGTGDFQHPDHQCLPDAGPVPEGLYKVYAIDHGIAKDDGTGTCNLAPSWGFQQIPRGASAGACEPYWANWGDNRVRMEAADDATKKVCPKGRGGFYLHDSTKGYSHGCIEVETGFFSALRAQVRNAVRGRFILRVKYVSGRKTNGGTRG